MTDEPVPIERAKEEIAEALVAVMHHLGDLGHDAYGLRAADLREFITDMVEWSKGHPDEKEPFVEKELSYLRRHLEDIGSKNMALAMANCLSAWRAILASKDGKIPARILAPLRLL